MLDLPPRTQQILAIGLPMGALAISLFVAYPAWLQYQNAERMIKERTVELNRLKTTPIPARDPVQVAAEALQSEPSTFLGEISRLVVFNGCELVGLDSPPVPETTEGEPARPIRATLTARGEYPQLRALLNSLSNSSRLYVVTDLNLQKSPGGVTAEDSTSRRLNAVVSIERYVLRPASASSVTP